MRKKPFDDGKVERRYLATKSMNDEQARQFRVLVEAYLEAYEERMHPREGGERPLRGGYPLRQEYEAVLAFVRSLSVSAQRYSEKSIESFVDDLLTAVLLDGSRLDVEIEDLANLLNHELTTRLYVPLDGVICDSTYKIGALHVIRMDSEEFERLIVEPFAETMKSNPRYNESGVMAARVEDHRNRLLSLRDRTCAEVETHLDIPRTFEFADAVAIGALCDFLQFAASLFLAHDERLKIAWATDGGVLWRHAFAASDDPQRHCNQHNRLASVAYPFEITADRVKQISIRFGSCG